MDNEKPFALTTQQVQREIQSLEKLFEQRVQALEKAVALAHENLTRVPTDVDKAVNHVRALFDEKLNVHNERFASVHTQFKERDVRTEQTARDSKVAVDAALQAAKEAVGEQNKSSALAIAKSETATTKQIDQIGVQIATNNKASDDKINDLKERLSMLDGRKEGISDTKAAGLAILTVVVALFGGSLLNKRDPLPQPTVAYVPAPVVAPTPGAK